MFLFTLGSTCHLQAGGSGLNTVVIVNQSSTNSVELGNYYCERRQVPSDNLFRISWTGVTTTWNSDQFQTNLLNPLLQMLTNRQLTNQVDYVVLSMDIPYQITYGTAINSTTAALFYGLKSNQGTDLLMLTNSYASSEATFAQAKPAAASGPSFLAVMLTSTSLAQAKRLVDQGVAGDSTFPSQPVVLAKSSDQYRNIRFYEFDNALFNTRIVGDSTLFRTNVDSPWGQTNLFGYQTGLAYFGVSSNAFVPGAMADSLTSYGGLILGGTDQSNLLTFINAGAAGSYGTVAEPSPIPQRFPNPQDYFYQARGFSLAECYYQSLYQPFLGLIVGEPLSAPFAQAGSGQWTGIGSNAMLNGSAQLSVAFGAGDSNHPLHQVDLFVDGKFFQTLTNLAPQPGNTLALTLNNQPVTYIVPANATLASVSAGLAAALNTVTNATQVAAFPAGDRIELHSLNTNLPASSFSFTDTQAGNWSRRFYRTVPLLSGATQPTLTLLTPSGNGGRSLRIDRAVAPYVLQASTDLRQWTPVATNQAAGIAPTTTTSSAGSAGWLTTFVRASRGVFTESPAAGYQSFDVAGGVTVGTRLQLNVIKTNGATVSIAVTNQSAGAAVTDLVQQFINALNSAPALQGSDGLQAQDISSGWNGSVNFNLYARSPGLSASQLQVQLTSSVDLTPTPGGPVSLNANLSDLQPRNHLYVTAGVTNLSLMFPLDTTRVPDGFHILTALAYEGSSVHTQTRASLPILIHNSSLSATLTFLDLTTPALVQKIYHVRVAVNTSPISAIRLYSTGGLMAKIINQSASTFTVNGSFLGPGLHPFYALVDPPSGPSYRTDTTWVRLVSGP